MKKVMKISTLALGLFMMNTLAFANVGGDCTFVPGEIEGTCLTHEISPWNEINYCETNWLKYGDTINCTDPGSLF